VLLPCGPAVASGLHGTGMDMGHRQHLHGVGLAGAWVWGGITTCPVWSGPGWCSGHWCGLATPRNIEVTAVSGDTACLGLWEVRVLCPGTSSRGCHGLVCCVLCVVVPGAGRSGLLLWVGVLCDMVAWVGQCEHGRGTRTMHLAGLPLVGSPLLSVAPRCGHDYGLLVHIPIHPRFPFIPLPVPITPYLTTSPFLTHFSFPLFLTN
jgi:hypothetical protein